LELTDLLIPSEEFALEHTGAATAKEAAIALMERYHPKAVVITQGKEGGILLSEGKPIAYPSFPINAVDTNGSGDVFHGAFAAALCKGYDYKKACIFSSAVSAIKCTGYGARESVPSFETVKSFLKEKNYEL
jgi:sulfofructose kinase